MTQDAASIDPVAAALESKFIAFHQSLSPDEQERLAALVRSGKAGIAEPEGDTSGYYGWTAADCW